MAHIMNTPGEFQRIFRHSWELTFFLDRLINHHKYPHHFPENFDFRELENRCTGYTKMVMTYVLTHPGEFQRLFAGTFGCKIAYFYPDFRENLVNFVLEDATRFKEIFPNAQEFLGFIYCSYLKVRICIIIHYA